MNNRFTVDYTVFVKGLAIILLLLHHYIGVDPNASIDISNISFKEIIYSLSKVCVSIFAVMSGYGIYLSLSKKTNKIRYIFKKIAILYVAYWMTMIIYYLFYLKSGTLGSIYGKTNTIVYVIKDLFGMCNEVIVTPAVNKPAWFIGTVIIFYIISPVLIVIVNKIKKYDFLLLIISFVPWILFLFGIKIGQTTDSALYYLTAFLLGILLAKHCLLDVAVRKANKPTFVITVLFATLLIAVVRLFSGIVLDVVFAMSLILLSVIIYKKVKIVDMLIAYIGKVELFIYLLHGFTLVFFSYHISNSILLRIVAVISVIIMATIFNYAYNTIKKRVMT